jgi:hypothetical protein
LIARKEAHMDKKYMPLGKTEERVGQYATRSKAIKECKRLLSETGKKHKYILTTCYRDNGLTPRVCWATYLK